MRRPPVAFLGALLLALAVAACGGGSGSSSSAPVEGARLSPAVAKRANAICRQFERELVAIAEGIANPPDTVLELTTERLVKPFIPVLEKTATRLRAVGKPGADPSYDLFVELFDPGIVLAEKRVKAGEEGSVALPRARAAADQPQRNATGSRRRRGLADWCSSIDFSHVLQASISE